MSLKIIKDGEVVHNDKKAVQLEAVSNQTELEKTLILKEIRIMELEKSLNTLIRKMSNE
jgi:hypothetical protein